MSREHWQNLSYFGTLLSTGGLRLPGEGLDGKFQLILVIFSSQHRNYHSCPTAGSFGRQPRTLSRSSFHTAFQEPEWAKKTLCSKYQGSVLQSLIVFSDCICAKRQMAIAVSSCPSSWGIKRAGTYLPLPPSSFSFSSSGKQILKTRTLKSNCIYKRSKKVSMHAQRRAQAQKRPDKTLHLYL